MAHGLWLSGNGAGKTYDRAGLVARRVSATQSESLPESPEGRDRYPFTAFIAMDGMYAGFAS